MAYLPLLPIRLMILMGGMGTLSGAMVVAAFKLMDFYLFKRFEENAGFILGVGYVVFVLFVPC